MSLAFGVCGAGIVANPADYLYSSAIDYEEGKGLIEIDLLIG